MISNIYREELLDHFHHPFNFGKLDKCDRYARQTNPFCGDEIELFLALNKSQINNISFLGKGCAISIAAASILTEYAKGRTTEELTKCTNEDMLDLLNVNISETRKKCALLGLSVLRDCLYANTKSKTLNSK